MSFPTTVLLDNFNRTESPINNGGNWAQMFESAEAGDANGTRYAGESAFGAPESRAYWTKEEFGPPAAVAIIPEATTGGRYPAVYACLSNPTNSNISGYELRVAQEESGVYELEIYRIDKNAPTLLATKSKVALNGTEDRVGLVIQAGKVEAWVKIKGGAWTLSFNETDSTYTKGFIGIASRGAGNTFADEFEGGQVGKEPTVTKLNPSSGPTGGGNEVLLTGTEFIGVTAVKFGGNSATFEKISTTKILAKAPAHTAGTVHVTVTTPEGTSAETAANEYVYHATTANPVGLIIG